MSELFGSAVIKVKGNVKPKPRALCALLPLVSNSNGFKTLRMSIRVNYHTWKSFVSQLSFRSK